MVLTEPLAARELQQAPQSLRRAYVIAMSREQNAEGFAVLTEAHLSLHGRRGSRVSPLTLLTYRQGVRHLLDWCIQHHRDLLTLTRDQAAMYARDLERDGKSPSTVAVYLAAARNLYAALRWSDALATSPFEDVHHATDPTPPHEKRDPYPDEDIEQLVKHLWDTGNVRLMALVLLCGHVGLRIHEAVGLTWSDVQGDRARVTGKGGKKRTVVLSRRTVDVLRVLREVRGKDALVLGWGTTHGARAALKNGCHAAGVPYIGAHALRHSCGTRLMRETGNLLIVARQLGHTDVNTSARYTKTPDSQSHPIQAW